MRQNPVLVLGSFVADVNFRLPRLPAWGETLMGSAFHLGPGGKGSNQAVAAARAGASVRMLTRLGSDAFGQMARSLWSEAGIDATLVSTSEVPTGSAAILIDENRGENAIIVVPGACFTLTPEDVECTQAAMASSGILLAQLELPLVTVERGLRIARDAGVTTILNPAPAPSAPLPDTLLQATDFLIPNETEAATLTGLPVTGVAEAGLAARELQVRGARHVIIMLGERGALVCAQGGEPTLVPAFLAGPVAETTGAGDAFCGAFAAALADGTELLEAVRFGCAGAAISVTRAGAAPSMPFHKEIEVLLQANSRH